jgi:hypothetical protein
VEKSSERLVTAYQEGLVTLAQLRQRMPALQKQTQAVESELQSLKMAAVDEAKYLQLAESLAGFRSKLRVRAEVLDIAVRQQILRLLVKEVLVGADTITLRHSIPIPQSGPGSNGSQVPPSGVTGSRPNPGYLLRSRSHDTALRRALLTRDQLAVLLHVRKPKDRRGGDRLLRKPVIDICVKAGNQRFQMALRPLAGAPEQVVRRCERRPCRQFGQHYVRHGVGASVSPTVTMPLPPLTTASCRTANFSGPALPSTTPHASSPGGRSDSTAATMVRRRERAPGGRTRGRSRAPHDRLLVPT